ncbi:hypothetical protein L6R50_00450 [Myxococcota bacterium]|nr:hypothetical protein [Myxococcota bacterium]
MTQPAERPFVGRTDSLLALREEKSHAAAGPRFVLLSGGLGSGRKRLVGRFMEEVVPEAIAVRLAPAEGEDGVRTLLRLYGTFVASLARGDSVGGRALDALRSAAEAADERRKAWLEGLVATVQKASGRPQGENLQIQLPRDNPYLALVEGIGAVAAKVPVVLELQDLLHSTSPAFWAALSALFAEARSRGLPLLAILSAGESGFSGAPDEAQPGPATWLHDLTRATEPRVIDLPPFTLAEVEDLLRVTYRPHAFPEGFAERLLKLTGGRPGVLAEVLTHLEDDEDIVSDASRGYYLDTDLDDLAWDALVPFPWESAEGGEPTTADEATRDRMARALHVAAIEGEVFSSGVLAEALSLSRDEVDDLLDEMPGVVEEVQFVEAANTWLYRFRRTFYRDWFLRNPPGGKVERDLPVQIAGILVRGYAPVVFDYLARAARLFSEAGERRKAQNLLTLALTADRPEVARFGLEVLEERADVPFPTGLASLAFTGVADRAVNALADAEAEDFVSRAERYADRAGDGAARDFARLLRSRLALRRGDLPGSRQHAEAALAGAEARRDAVRQAEALNQLAILSLHARDLEAARKAVDLAGKASNIPPVRAHTLFVKGLLQKADRKVGGAADSFRQAADLALQTGNLALVLEATVNAGEALLISGRPKEAARALRQARQMTRGSRSPRRDRGILQLLSQAEAAAGNPAEALDLAQEALQLTRDLGLKQQEQIDLYHCGLFSLAAGREEADSYLKEAARVARENKDRAILKEVLFNHGQLLHSRGDDPQAIAALEEALGLCRELNDRWKANRSQLVLGMAHERAGQRDQALVRYREALAGLEGPTAADEKKRLEQKVLELEATA